MARSKKKDLPDLRHLAVPGAEIAVRVTPNAARRSVSLTDSGLKISVTEVPEKGKATEAVRSLLARAMGVCASDLELRRGGTSRNKVFLFHGFESGTK